MHPAIISRVLGILLVIYSIALVPPVIVSLVFKDNVHFAFLITIGITFSTGLFLWSLARHKRQDLRTRDGFVVTALFWTVLGLFGSLPFMLAEAPGLSFSDAVFESLSGLTTTGATVITGLDYLPESILLYRQLLQWLGGIGIIVIAMAILPMLGIGGMQLYRAETPGPVKDTKLTPRIKETANALIFIYVGLTILCCAAYWYAGMSFFDAICHAFSTVAIGGFSTHDASIGYFDSPSIMIVAMIFMFFSGINFALHFFAWNSRSLKQYFLDPECKFYAYCIAIGLITTAGYLFYSGTYGVKDSLLLGSFELVSIVTTTGFGATDFNAWPSFLPFMLFFGAFMGGCAGSTGGGMKVIRVLLVCKQAVREMHRLIHPNAVIPIKIGNKPVSDRVVDAVWGFFAAYVFVFVAMFLLLMAAGLDFTTAFSAVAACINNLGPGMGDVAFHYGNIPVFAKWVLCFAMLLGRLEVFTLLVLFSPMFWRR
ncbi:MAG: TrkH family potassium uptake protein [Cellvibrionaceae bacterium]